jgi:hypothetical protein
MRCICQWRARASRKTEASAPTIPKTLRIGNKTSPALHKTAIDLITEPEKHSRSPCHHSLFLLFVIVARNLSQLLFKAVAQATGSVVCRMRNTARHNNLHFCASTAVGPVHIRR